MAVSASAALVPLQITVTSDTICPFCFLGLRKLEKALQSSPHTSSSSPSRFFTPSIRFLPYQLDASLPTSHALNKREVYRSKFGAERVKSMETMMARNGEPYGISFNYDGVVRNTTLSHRLMEVAFDKGGWEKQLGLLNVLFPHYFEKAGDPGDADALSDIGVQSGIFATKDEAKAFFAGSQYEEEVQRAFREAHAKGITGVPHFELLAGDVKQSAGDTQAIKAEIPGAQDPETFVAVFKQIAEAYTRANGGSANVNVASTGSKC